MTNRRFQYRLVSWFWLTLVVAAFFLGHNWGRREHRSSPPAATPGKLLFGAGVTSHAGVTGAIVVDESSFAVIAAQPDAE